MGLNRDGPGGQSTTISEYNRDAMTNYFNSRPFLLLSRAMEFYNAYGRVKGEWLGKVVLVAVVVVVVVAVAVRGGRL